MYIRKLVYLISFKWMYLQNCSIISENIVIAFWRYYRNEGIILHLYKLYMYIVYTSNIFIPTPNI